MTDIDDRERRHILNKKGSVLDLEEAEKRNEAAKLGLEMYYENVVRDDEIPCNRRECCDYMSATIDSCRGCEWEDFDEVGLWEIKDPKRLGDLYEREDPEPYPSNPFRYSHVIEEWIVPGAIMKFVSGCSIVDMMDEYERFACLHYAYRYVGGSMHDHSHEFAGVVSSLLRNPEKFYIPIWAEEEYSEQEILFLEVVRERLCHDNGCAPLVDIVWADEEDGKRYKEYQKENEEGGSVFGMRVRAHIAEMRAETKEKLGIANSGDDANQDGIESD